MSEKSIVTRPTPPTDGGVQAHFVPSKFDALVRAQGARVFHERALRCPCASRNVGNAQLAGCRNCGGLGWVFINKTETRMVLQHQNLKVSYEAGSDRIEGMVSVTSIAGDRLCRMDRITEPDAESTHNQLLQFKLLTSEGRWFCYTDYPIKQALNVFMFQNADAKLIPLVEGVDFTLGDQRIILAADFDDLSEVTLSITYVHMPQFYIWELSRATITVNTKSAQGGKKEAQRMPLSALAKKAEFVLDQNSFSGEQLLDNSTHSLCRLEK